MDDVIPGHFPGNARDDGDATSPRSGRAWRRRRWQIATVLTVGAAVIAALWLIIVVAMETERQAAIEHARNDADNLSAAFQAEVAGKLDMVARALDIVSAAMQADPDLNIYTWARKQPFLAAMPINAAGILSPNGELSSVTTVAQPPALDYSDRDFFRLQRSAMGPKTFVSPLTIGRITRQPVLQISRRVATADGRFLGVVVFSLRPDQLTALPRSANLGAHGLLSLVGNDGIIRARFGADSPDGMHGVGMRVPSLPVDSGSVEQSFIRLSPVDHVMRLFSIRQIAGYSLRVAVGRDLTDILRPVTAHAWLLQTVGSIITFVLCGMMALLVTEIRRRTDREVKLAREQARLANEVRVGRRVQEQLESSQTRLQDFAVMASDWFWEQDADLRFTDIGVGAPGQYAGSASGVGKYRWEYGDPSNPPELWEAHKRDLAEHKPIRDFRYCVQGRDAQLHFVSVNGIPIYDRAGRFTGYRGTGRDVTAEVAAEAELRTAKERAEQAETLLRDAVDSISEGFVIFDREDRFVIVNETYRRFYPESANLLAPGIQFEDFVRHLVANGGLPDARGREDEFFAERMRQHWAAEGATEQQLNDGSWILVTDRRMKNGGIAGLRIDITALKQTQAALRDSEARLDRAQATAGIGSWELNVATGRFIWSRQMYRMRGVEPTTFEPTLDTILANVHADDIPAVLHWYEALIAGREQDARETRIMRPNGEVQIVRAEGYPIVDADGVIHRLAGTQQDITERRQMERELAQAQKMEAMGRLTGGMAHDFNNGLGVIIGNLELLGRLVQTNQMAAELCDEARAGALRCADLIQRLLAFARRQPLRPQPTDVNLLVDNMTRLLSRTLGEDIELIVDLGSDLRSIATDPAQLEAALTNLANNARDAMPRGGRLDIATTMAELDAGYAAQHPEAKPGTYLVIEVSDTGTGISSDIVNRIFDPFFTTKEPGQGTGLGLSMVFGFIKQSGGHITVYSELALGTTFRIYLPCDTTGEPAPVGWERDGNAMVGGDETILVVEDNAPLRQATVQQLTELGYRVLAAEHAAAALQILHREDVHLLFTDVVMPGNMDGLDLADRTTTLRPGIKILLSSGFPGLRGADKRMADSPFRLINKPYRQADLARALRELLDTDETQTTATTAGRFDREGYDLYDREGVSERERV